MVYFVIGIFVGSVLGSLTLALLTLASKEDDFMEHVCEVEHYAFIQEEFMQRLYHISKEIECEDPKERMEKYRKMVGCQWCNRKAAQE